MATYTVRLEHGRRRDHADLAIPADGPVSPAYLQHPVDVSHVQVHVDDHDAQGRPRPGIEMDNEARWTATMMHADQPGRPTDMVTKADIVRMEASLPTRPDPAENGSHERTAGKGKPRHDAPDVDRRAGAPGADEAAAVAQDSGRDRDGQGARGPEAQGQELRPLAEHPKLDSDLSRLPKAVRQNYRLRVDDLRRGIPHSSTHPLHGPLKGWHATSIGGTNQFRVVHRYAGDSLQVLSAGNHDEAYDAGIRREAADRGFSEHNRFLERLDKGPEEEPFLHGRRDEYAKDVTTHTGHQYTLMTGTHGLGGNETVTAHRRLSNGKYQGVGYLSWFGGNPEREGREGNTSPGTIYKVHVAEQHRRRGVASAMLDFARERYPHMDIRHSTALSDDGRAWSEKKAVQTPPEGLNFTHDEFETGGSKYPTRVHLRAHLADGEQVGALIYHPPRRRNGIVQVHNLHVEPWARRQGIGSALMDEMQRRHPDSTIDHGSRTYDGEDWWKGYTDGKVVRRGRTAGQVPGVGGPARFGRVLALDGQEAAQGVWPHLGEGQAAVRPPSGVHTAGGTASGSAREGATHLRQPAVPESGALAQGLSGGQRQGHVGARAAGSRGSARGQEFGSQADTRAGGADPRQVRAGRDLLPPARARVRDQQGPGGSYRDGPELAVTDGKQVRRGRTAALNDPGSLHELVKHQEGRQTLFAPADGSGHPACAFHAMDDQRWKARMHEFGQHVRLIGPDEPTPDEPALRQVGRGSCGRCAEQQRNQTRYGPEPKQVETRPRYLNSPYRPEPASTKNKVGPFEPLRQSLNAFSGHLDDEARVSVAEQAMERGGLAGRAWHVPKVRHSFGDPTPEAHKPVHEFVNGVLQSEGHPGGIRVSPSHWDLREPGSGQAVTDGMNYIGLKGEHTNDMTLLHECAHILSRTPEGPGGHGQAFQQAAHDLYGKHLGPEAAETFRGILEPSGSAKLAATEHWPPYLTEREDRNGDTYPANVSRSNPRGPVGTEDDAKAAGLVGPYFHGTSKRRAREIRRGGFRQPRMPNWEMGNAGTAEEVDMGNTHRTYFAESHDEAMHFARGHHGDDADVVAAYLHPDHIEHDKGGGWMPSVTVKDVAHAMAIRPPQRTGARFTPTRRVFSHTCGLDHRLWDADGQLKSDVRRYILKSISTMWAGEYRHWSEWARVYFAGSEASEWTSDTLEGNNDFDVLIGVDYRAFRQANPRYAHVSNQRITDEMNHGFRTWNAEVMIVVDGTPTGPWDRTTYVNPDSHDIRKIKPYAAYDVGKNEWVVKPPHLPHWSIDDLPKPVIRALRAADAYAHSVLKLPEPERTQQGAALFDAWHSDRSRAFSERGEGWFDIANLREKWLDQEGVWAELVNCKHRADEGLDKALPTWSNTPPGYVAAKLPKTQKCKYCAQQATQRVIHSEGMACIPTCDEHLGKAKDDAARCTPDGSVDPSNVNAVRKIASVDDDDEEVEAGYLTPEHYKKLTFTDFPGRDISYVHQALTHREPNYMRHLTNDVIRNGVKHPIEIAHHDNDEWEVGGGHHRAAAAWKLGKPAPYVRTAEHGDFDPGEEYYRDNTSWRNRRKAHPKEEQAYMRRGEADDPFKGKWASLQVKEYDGEVGNRNHITRGEVGELPIDAVRHMRGARGEVPGEHRNRQGQDWENFKADVAANGIRNPIFITVDHNQEPVLNEGSHRRDAAVELGHSHIPAEIRYFGHAEHQGTVEERASRQSKTAVTVPYIRNNGGMRHVPGFGQDVEPWGRYMSPHDGHVPEGWEHGEVDFANPLRMEHDFGGWKQKLSDYHDGLTGKDLSAALLAKGHDAVITHDEHGPVEMVDLRPRGQRTHRPFEGALRTVVANDRLHRAWGSNDASTLFGDAPTTSVPFPSAGRRKDVKDYDPDLVRETLLHPEHHHMQEIDPRTLRATQPSITRGGVEHYMSGHYDRTGETYADQHNAGNRRPFVYQREDGQNLLLSGHHRAVSALLKGRPLQAIVVNGPWGPPRRPGR